MLKCVLFEQKKIRLAKFIVLLVVFLIIGNFVIYNLYNEKSFDSTQALIEEKQFYQEAMESIDGEDELGINEMCEKEIAIIEYCIENNISYKRLTVLSNLLYNKYLINIMVIFLIIVAYNYVSIEDDSNTWKNLIIVNKNNFKIIFIRKKIASYSTILASVVVFFLIAILFGCICYKSWENISISYEAGRVVANTNNAQIKEMIFTVLLKGFIYSSFAFFMACITSKNLVTIVIPIVCLLFESSITALLDKVEIAKILPFHNLNILENMYSYDSKDIVIALVYVIIMYIALEISSYLFIKRKGLCV